MIETISRDRLIELLEQGSSQRIAIIGDAMLDVYLRGDVERISPEAPVPVVRVRDKELALAMNIRSLGDLAGALGLDLSGAVSDKSAFNLVRSDHKHENRVKPGGKKY